MCVRLSPSHPAARIVVGLYILLATFLIGFFVVKMTNLSFLSGTAIWEAAAVGNNTETETSRTVDLVKPLEPKGCTNADGILISRWHDVPLQEIPSFTTIGITNEGSVPIHPGVLYVDSWAPEAGPVEYSRVYAERTGEDVEINRVEDPKPVGHLETSQFELPITGDDRMVVTFDYKLGDDPTHHRMHAFIPRGLQFPISCF